MLSSALLLILGVSIPALARPALTRPGRPSEPSPTSFTSKVIFQSPNSLFLENIAVRASSDLLLTSIASPTLFTLDPTTINGTLNTVHTFPNATSPTGITEYRPGVFAVAASITNSTTRRAVPDSSVIWSVDFNTQSQTPTVRVLARLPGDASANGLTSVPRHPDLLLAADSNAGAVWQVKVCTGNTSLVIQDASMLANAPPPALGINGLHVGGTPAAPLLYFATSAQGTFSSLPLQVNAQGNVVPGGAVQTLASIQPVGGQQAPDDFALDSKGRAWVAVHPGALTLLSPPTNGNGNFTQLTAVGDAQGTDAGLIQPTSAAFGRGKQANMLYVTTGVGQVVAVDTRGNI